MNYYFCNREKENLRKVRRRQTLNCDETDGTENKRQTKNTRGENVTYIDHSDCRMYELPGKIIKLKSTS